MKKNYFKSLMQAAVLVCTPLVIASCDDVFGDTDNPIPAYMSIKQSDINLVLHKDSLDKATATRTAIAATGAEVVYSSSNEKVATVDAKTGVITAVGGGDCEIIAEVTGKDSNGRDTYQPQKASFKVSVKDYRARIALKEGATKAVYNSALVDNEPIDLTEVLDVFPKTGLTIDYGTLDDDGNFVKFTAAQITSNKVIDAIAADGKITLEQSYPSFSDDNHKEATKVVAHISAVPDGYETKSFQKQQTTAEFTIEVREGIAYINIDAAGKPETKSMFYLDNDDEGTLPNYTKLSKVLKYQDVYLAAGTYYLDADVDFYKSIRMKGDANIILGDGNTLNMNWNTNSIMDESAKKNYTLNIYGQKNQTGKLYYLPKFQDFKAVNVYGGLIGDDNTPWPHFQAIETVNIVNGKVYAHFEDVATVNANKGVVQGYLTKVGTATIGEGEYTGLYDITTLNFKKGTVTGSISKVGTATISDGTFQSLNNITTLNFKKGTVNNAISKIGTATIEDGTFNDGYFTVSSTSFWASMYDITTLNFKKGTVNGSLNTIKTATLEDGTFNGNINNITTLNFKKGTVNWVNFTKIGTATISDGTINAYQITADALNIDGGKVNVSGDKVKAAVTMNGGELTVWQNWENDAYAVIGDVTVNKGKFSATSANYHAVDGKLAGTFFSSATGTAGSWKAVTSETSTDKYIKSWNPDSAE